ncbi:DUF1919 domain-containing protein [Faecalimonas umbilicata]|uniref:DUF1919 domain-containing protein n=1 Tax=Faecalimonas umbilicata TaxID=1912855 RepID=UPI0039952269
MIYNKVSNKIKTYIWKWKHEKRNIENRKRLKNKEISIISTNCIGGVLSHDLGLQFKSPTVNLFFRAEDFIKFCENLEYYMSIDRFVECYDEKIIEDRTYPVAYLGDLTLYLVHYSSVEEAEKKWNERKQRINWENIAIFNTDREGMTEELRDRFEKLPYRKVMFVNKPDKKHASCYYLQGFENEDCVGIITNPMGWKGMRQIDQFDYVSFLDGRDCVE